MGLIGNYQALNKSCGRFLGGSTLSDNRSNWTTPGQMRGVQFGDMAEGSRRRWSVPTATEDAYAWFLPQIGGELGSTTGVSGSGSLSGANLAMGLAHAAALDGSGDLTSGQLGLIVSLLADLTGEGVVEGDTPGGSLPDLLLPLQMAAALTASGNITAALTAIGHFTASLSGSGDVSAAAVNGYASMASEINVTGELLTTANVADAVWEYLAEGNYSAAGILRLLASVAAGKTDITGTTVTFRDLGDTKDRIVASMSGSERSTVTIDQD